MTNETSKSERSRIAKIFSQMGIAATKKKYGNAHYFKMSKASVDKLKNTLSMEERSNRAKLIRYKIPYSNLKPSEYGKAVADYRATRDKVSGVRDS